MNRISVSYARNIPVNFTGIVDFIDNPSYIQATYLNGEHHSFDDQPAIRYSVGSLGWYKEGYVHRFGAPAYIIHGKGEFWLDNVRWANENNYWKECWKRYRTPENEQLIMAKLLAAK